MWRDGDPLAFGVGRCLRRRVGEPRCQPGAEPLAVTVPVAVTLAIAAGGFACGRALAFRHGLTRGGIAAGGQS